MRNVARSTIFVFALAGWGSAPTFAQSTSSEEQRPTIKIGPVELWPLILVRNIGVDANVYNDPVNPVRDFTATVAPNLELVVRPSWMRLSYTSISEFVYFREEKSQRSVNRGFQTRADFNLSYFQPYVVAGGLLTRERQNTEIDIRARRQLRNYGAGVRMRLWTSTSVSAGFRKNTSKFVEANQFRGVDLGSQLNNETDAIDASLTVDVTPLTTLGVAVASEHDRFDGSPLRNSDALRITPTISFKPFGMFNGSASVGYLRFDAFDPAVEDYAGLVASGTIGVLVLERFKLDTTFGRDVRYSYDAQTPTYIWTSGRGTLRTDLIRGLDVSITGGRDVMNYRPLAGLTAAGKDTYLVYGGGLGYTISNRIRVGVEAEFYERRSRLLDRGFENNRVFGTLTWGARPQ